mgnify:CR=1 FL=1
MPAKNCKEKPRIFFIGSLCVLVNVHLITGTIRDRPLGKFEGWEGLGRDGGVVEEKIFPA